MLGSGYYSLHPLVPPAQVVANINLDMVGRSDGTVEVIAGVSRDLFAAASGASRGTGIQVVPDRNPQKRLLYFVDSHHFARLGVPAVEVFTAMHADYHQPSDEADKILYDRLAEVVDLTSRLVRHYADGAPRPRYQRPGWFIKPEMPARP